MSKKIIVKPLDIKKWHGKSGEDTIARPKVIRALIDAKTRKYRTGLTSEEIEDLSTKIGADLSDIYLGKAHPFWDSNIPTIKLEQMTQIFDIDNPLDYIKVQILKSSKFVANSQEDYEKGLCPEGTHVMTDSEEDVKIKANRIQIKKRAILECAELGKEKKVNLVTVLSGKMVRNKSDNFIEVELDKLIEKRASDVLRHLAGDSKELEVSSRVLEAINKSVIIKRGVKFMYEDSNIGTSVDEVVDFFSQDDNQMVYISLLKKLD